MNIKLKWQWAELNSFQDFLTFIVVSLVKLQSTINNPTYNIYYVLDYSEDAECGPNDDGKIVEQGCRTYVKTLNCINFVSLF